LSEEQPERPLLITCDINKSVYLRQSQIVEKYRVLQRWSAHYF